MSRPKISDLVAALKRDGCSVEIGKGGVVTITLEPNSLALESLLCAVLAITRPHNIEFHRGNSTDDTAHELQEEWVRLDPGAAEAFKQ